jgi:hypothetical protein
VTMALGPGFAGLVWGYMVSGDGDALASGFVENSESLALLEEICVSSQARDRAAMFWSSTEFVFLMATSSSLSKC